MSEAKANRLYKKFTRDMKRDLGTEFQWSDALTRVGKKHLGDKFLGCFARDTINYHDMNPGESALVNTLTSNTRGEHWCAVGCDEKNQIVVYDSFGREGAKLLHIKAVSVKNTDRDAEQKVKEVDCGPRSLAWCCVFSQNSELAMLI